MMMNVTRKPRSGQIYYVICSLVYISLILFAGRTEFTRVNTQFRQARERLNPVLIKDSALMELRDECRKKSLSLTRQKGTEGNRGQNDIVGAIGQDDCLDQAQSVVTVRAEQLTARFTGERDRAAKKFVLFYVCFLFIFLIIPLALLYWAGVFFRTAFKG